MLAVRTQCVGLLAMERKPLVGSGFVGESRILTPL